MQWTTEQFMAFLRIVRAEILVWEFSGAEGCRLLKVVGFNEKKCDFVHFLVLYILKESIKYGFQFLEGIGVCN